ncbi:hypothetical protein TNCV_2565551 [Trichonephila clavipes]|uniref:Uncharacterized protein n=1 Tax=Trichonephila clavipes TaxID=2585209 RepID=A0A8X6SK08_TRICX|nr:hypothetical protein TNCV_2565551 [Trichonephila clavipes]
MEMQYQKTLLPQGGGQWRKKPNENETGVTSRGREWKSAGRGQTAPKRVRGAPKRSREKELLLFFRSQNEKEWSLQVETYKRNSRRKRQEPVFSLIPVSTSGKRI